ncbi:MAG: hypothetical protein QME78_03390 [Thermodesulfobacteriota bacterium]|nr:hypothetical protein [Thermodesulfobacteriota bacterium]
MSNGEKEEIIELTEVVDESPRPEEKKGEKASFGPADEPGEGQSHQREAMQSPPEGISPVMAIPDWEKSPAPVIEQSVAKDEPREVEQAKPSFYDYESEIRSLREALNARAERWLATEGIQVLHQISREMIPRIAQELFGREIEKLKEEVEKVRAEKEALSAGAQQWLDSEGLQVLNQGVREVIPRIAREVLDKETEKVQGVVEEVRSLKEALKVKAEQWLGSEGAEVLNQGARELLPGIAEKILQDEIEKLQAQVEKVGVLIEELNVKAKGWFASEGARILERAAGEMFPRIAEDILRQEIEKLKTEAEEKA